MLLPAFNKCFFLEAHQTLFFNTVSQYCKNPWSLSSIIFLSNTCFFVDCLCVTNRFPNEVMHNCADSARLYTLPLTWNYPPPSVLLIKQSKTKPTTLQLSFILFSHDVYRQVAYLDQLYCDINKYYSWSSFCTTISSTISASDSWAMRGVGGPTTQLLLLEHVSDWFKMHWNSKEKA